MQAFSLLRQTYRSWSEDRAPQLAASTAYYTLFSMAPILILTIAFAGMFLDPNAVRQQVFGQLRGLLGDDGARAIQGIVEAANASPNTGWAALVGIVTLLLGASGLLAALQDAFNGMWKVRARKTTKGWKVLALRRLTSIAMIMTIGFLLLVSLVVSAVITFFLDWIAASAPSLTVILPGVNFVFSLLVTSALFGLLFTVLPDVRIPWKAIWPGAFFTGLLFTLGKTLLGWYLGSKDFTTAYGAAGSLILILLWVYYSAQILFFGMEMTKTIAEKRHVEVRAKKYAEFIEPPVIVKRTSPVAAVAATVLGVAAVEWKTVRGLWGVWRLWKRLRRKLS